MSDSRDGFSKTTKEEVAKRAHFLCSNPECRRQTSWPHSNEAKAFQTGVAAHIRAAAAQDGRRYDSKQSEAERSGIENAIWLCDVCHTKIDSDWEAYPVEKLLDWKKNHERWVADGFTVRDPANESLHDVVKSVLEAIRSLLRGNSTVPTAAQPTAGQPTADQPQPPQSGFDSTSFTADETAQKTAKNQSTQRAAVVQPSVEQNRREVNSSSGASKVDLPRVQRPVTPGHRPKTPHKGQITQRPKEQVKPRRSVLRKAAQSVLAISACVLLIGIAGDWYLNAAPDLIVSVPKQNGLVVRKQLDAPDASQKGRDKHFETLRGLPFEPGPLAVVGLVGQVRRPGVYEFGPTPLTCMRLVERIGGLHEDASGQFKVIRNGRPGVQFGRGEADKFQLRSGDLVVVESGDIIKAEGNAERQFAQIAFVNLVDRPVVLKLKIEHASLETILQLFNQDSSLAARVRVVLPSSLSFQEELHPNMALPSETVIIFPPNSIATDRLPTDLPPSIQLPGP